MVVEAFVESPLIRGFFIALLGVGVWVAGLVFFNWLWHHFRDDSEG
jgi:hypothetical protein